MSWYGQPMYPAAPMPAPQWADPRQQWPQHSAMQPYDPRMTPGPYPYPQQPPAMVPPYPASPMAPPMSPYGAPFMPEQPPLPNPYAPMHSTPMGMYPHAAPPPSPYGMPHAQHTPFAAPPPQLTHSHSFSEYEDDEPGTPTLFAKSRQMNRSSSATNMFDRTPSSVSELEAQLAEVRKAQEELVTLVATKHATPAADASVLSQISNLQNQLQSLLRHGQSSSSSSSRPANEALLAEIRQLRSELVSSLNVQSSPSTPAQPSTPPRAEPSSRSPPLRSALRAERSVPTDDDEDNTERPDIAEDTKAATKPASGAKMEALNRVAAFKARMEELRKAQEELSRRMGQSKGAAGESSGSKEQAESGKTSQLTSSSSSKQLKFSNDVEVFDPASDETTTVMLKSESAPKPAAAEAAAQPSVSRSAQPKPAQKQVVQRVAKVSGDNVMVEINPDEVKQTDDAFTQRRKQFGRSNRELRQLQKKRSDEYKEETSSEDELQCKVYVRGKAKARQLAMTLARKAQEQQRLKQGLVISQLRAPEEKTEQVIDEVVPKFNQVLSPQRIKVRKTVAVDAVEADVAPGKPVVEEGVDGQYMDVFRKEKKADGTIETVAEEEEVREIGGAPEELVPQFRPTKVVNTSGWFRRRTSSTDAA